MPARSKSARAGKSSWRSTAYDESKDGNMEAFIVPVYCYRCDDCGRVLEVKKTMAHAGDVEMCPDCGQLLRRKFVPADFIWGNNCWDFDNEGLGDRLILRHHD